MTGGLIHFADYEPQDIFFQRLCALTLEGLQIADSHRVFDAATLRHARKIRFSRCRAWLADPRSAVDFVIENENGKIGRLDVAESWKIVERQEHAAVGFKHDHFAPR